MDKNIYVLNNISFGYSKSLILNDVSLNIERGKFTAICGRNGAGKSTLLKILAGIIKPPKGEILVYGYNLANYKAGRLYKIISYVPQVHNIEIPLTVSEVIMTARNPYKSFIENINSEDKELLDRIVNQTGLSKYRDSLFNNLSGGEKQKVLIARALCQTDKIILLDEPTSSLDIGNKIEIMEILKQLSEKGTTVVTVSHDINEVNKYADNIVLVCADSVVTGNKQSVLTEENLTEIYETQIKILTTPEGNKFYY